MDVTGFWWWRFCWEDCDDIESKLIGRQLFIVNLDPQPNKEVVQCHADKRTKAQCQFHPNIPYFLAEANDYRTIQCINKTKLNYSQTASKMELLTGHIQTLIHLENGMTRQWWSPNPKMWMKFCQTMLNMVIMLVIFIQLRWFVSSDETIHAVIHCCKWSKWRQYSCGTLEKRI